MPAEVVAQFVGSAIFFVVWFWINGLAALRTREFLASRLGRQMYRNLSPRQAKLLGSLLLVGGVVFVGVAAWELYHGTFRWRGSERGYGFGDLLP